MGCQRNARDLSLRTTDFPSRLNHTEPMDKTAAQRLVRNTFKAPFDKKRYRAFVNELCNAFDESKPISSMGAPDAFAPHIKSCQRLGTFESPDGELTDVLVVRITESFKPKRDESCEEAGLVAFVAPEANSRRFSDVRMECGSLLLMSVATVKATLHQPIQLSSKRDFDLSCTPIPRRPGFRGRGGRRWVRSLCEGVVGQAGLSFSRLESRRTRTS
jgi:hypothetical protein